MPRRQKCKGRSKRSGEPCQLWARDGFDVCHIHGAGTRKRVQRGTRKDPAKAALKHGLYASRMNAEMREGVAEYLENRRELYRMDVVAARLWVLLERADRLAGVLEARMDELDALENEALAATLRREFDRLDSVRAVLNDLLKVILAHEKVQLGGAESVTRAQLVGWMMTFLGWVQQAAADESLPRDRIAEAVLGRMGAVAGLVGTDARGDTSGG